MGVKHDSESAPHRGPGVAFLLAQVGSYAAQAFAERVRALDLTPPQVGMLRAIGERPGASQQQLAGQLGMLPSRVVAFVDDLESTGLVERRRADTDRRRHALHLTADGHQLMRRIGTVARQHDEAITAGLTVAEKQRLTALLVKLAQQRGLASGVHPGFAQVRSP